MDNYCTLYVFAYLPTMNTAYKIIHKKFTCRPSPTEMKLRQLSTENHRGVQHNCIGNYPYTMIKYTKTADNIHKHQQKITSYTIS